jgi:hypothetical protein
MYMVAASGGSGVARVGAEPRGGEEELPGEFPRRLGVFFQDGRREPNLSAALGDIFGMPAADAVQLLL